MAGAGGIRAGRAYVELGTDDRIAAGLAKAERRLRAFGARISAMGMGFAKLGGVMLLPFIGGAKVFMDFGKNMANVATMLDDPAANMDRFRAGVRGLSKDVGESTATLAGGLYDILSASIAPSKALEVLAVSAKAAKAGLTDTKTAADAVTTILNSFKMSADQAASVSDLLFTVVRRGKTTFAELAPSIGMVASTAAAAGVPLEELGGMIATLTRNGVRTENAITAVNATIAAFLKPTDEAAQYAEKLGFTMSTTTLQAEGLEGVFKRIAKLPPDAIARLFPNIRALRGVIPALAAIEEFGEDVAAMADRAGATEAAYEKMADTLSFQWDQVKAAASDALLTIGESVKDSLGKAAKWIKVAADRIAEFIRQNKALVETIAKVAAALVILGVAMLAVGKIVSIVSVLWSLGTIAVKAYNIALWVLTAHPIVALIAAIAAAIVLVTGVIMYLIRASRKSQDESAGASAMAKKAAADAAAEMKKLDALTKKKAGARRERGRELADAEQIATVEQKIGKLRDRQADRDRTTAQRKIGQIRKEYDEQEKLLAQLLNIEAARRGGARGGRMAELQKRRDTAARAAGEAIMRIENAEQERRARQAARQRERMIRELVNLRAEQEGIDQRTARFELQYEQYLKKRDKASKRMRELQVERAFPGKTFDEFVKTISEGLFFVGRAGKVFEKTIGARGTFYGHVARALAGGTVGERTAKASEVTAKNTGKIVKLTQKARPAFAK